jgi:methyl-accepting chemotaxis protein
MKEIAKQSQRTYFISYQVRLLIGFTLLFTLVFAGAYYWFYTYATNVAIHRIEQDILDTLKGAAEGVDTDQFVALVNEGVIGEDGYTDDPRYWEHVDWLVSVSQIEPRAQVYSYIAGTEPKQVIFIGSIGAVAEPQWGVKFKEPYISSGRGDANLLTGLDRIGSKTDIYTDEFGTWMSGWGPIINSNGEKVGAIGVDFRADYVKEVQDGIRDSMYAAFAVTYIILFGLVYIVSLFFTRPIVALTRTAERIGDGDYNQDFTILKKGRFRNEFSSLADVFEIMVKKVYEREQGLRKQVEALKIVIDESKRQKQVNDIVESEFFQELKVKAQHMREQQKKGSG